MNATERFSHHNGKLAGSNAFNPIIFNSPQNQNKDEDLSTKWKQDGRNYEGPDQLLPSSAIRTSSASGAVKLSKLGLGASIDRAPISIPTLIQKAAMRAAGRTALVIKRDGCLQKWTYKQLVKDVRTAAKAFIALGLELNQSVCLLGSNSPEWIISNLAAIFAGGIAVGIVNTSSAKTCAYVAEDSKAQIFLVEDEEQLEKITCHKNVMKYLKAVVQFTGDASKSNLFSWDRFMEFGKNQADAILEERLKIIAINQCCTLVYTSGTTGNPKGVMFSHDNITWAAQSNCSTLKLKDYDEVFVSFLPLCHIAVQIYTLYMAFTCCASIHIADKNALKGDLIDTLKETQPTMMFAVPRIWEKMYEKMVEMERSLYWWTKYMMSWAQGKSLEYHNKRMETPDKAEENLSFKLGDKFLLSKIRNALGLGRCRIHLSGGAPISPEILNYFLSANILLTEAYGLTESTGPHCFGLDSGYRVGSVGRNMLGVTTRLDKANVEGQGEICLGGRNICMGYLNQPEKTREAIDEKRWLHTGDIGKIDKDGYIFVTGRIKEILILSCGINVVPVPIETQVKAALPILSQAMLVGEKKEFLSVLLTLKTETDKETMQPLDILQKCSREWINANGDCRVNTVQDVLYELYEKKNHNLISAIQTGIDEVNAIADSDAHKIQRWHLLPVDFSISGGELGPILKLMRAAVLHKYQHIIYKLYS